MPTLPNKVTVETDNSSFFGPTKSILTVSDQPTQAAIKEILRSIRSDMPLEVHGQRPVKATSNLEKGEYQKLQDKLFKLINAETGAENILETIKTIRDSIDLSASPASRAVKEALTTLRHAYKNGGTARYEQGKVVEVEVKVKAKPEAGREKYEHTEMDDKSPGGGKPEL